IGVLAMCLGLMRWPSIHWVLAEAYASGSSEARHAIAATFSGLNLYLGNYIGEFLGEVCLGMFFVLSGLALGAEPGLPGWLGIRRGARPGLSSCPAPPPRARSP